VGPLIVVAISAAAGAALAIASVWIGGTFERISVRVMDVWFAFPALLFAVLAVAVFGTGFLAPVLALSIAYAPYMARIVRSVARRERQMPYIDACQLGGLSGWRICSRHLLPNVRGVILAQATVGFGGALVDLAAISFIGLGVQPPHTEWGLMVADGTTALLNGYPRQCMAAGLMIVLTVVAFNVLGERIARRSGPQR
jgi:peptide/nickel transport system permease protein